jgi:glycosyltransferase involved in cell wall biosynthesis
VAFGGYQQGVSGAERMAWRTAEWLRRLGRQVVVLTDSPPPPAMDDTGVPVVSSPAELASRLPGFRPAVVHAFDLAKPEPVAVAARLAAGFRAPLALTPASAVGVWADPAGAQAACRQAGVVFALTGAEAGQLRNAGVPAERIRLIPQASDLAGTARPERFRRRYAISGPAVLFAGRRTALKGYQVLLRASSLVWRRRPETEFVFIGPDSDADTASVFAAHADRRVHDLRVVDEQTKHDALAACAVLCLPTSADVFPLVLLEAWGCGKPVVSGDFAGSEDVIRDGVDGLIVPPEPEPVAGALAGLLADDARRLAMGRAGLSRSRTEFGWHRVAAACDAGYTWALQVKAPAS